MFREETGADGERVGQYSYIDENGQTITVRYTAGKDGFRILEGSHIPEGANGLQSAPFDPEIAAGEPQQVAQQPQAVPVTPQPRPVRPVRPAQQRQQFVPQPQVQVPSSDFNPFINPADPTHLDFQTNVNAAQFRPRPAPRQQSVQRQQFQQAPVQRQQFQQAPVQQQTIPSPSSVPACANCAGVNPFLNPADSSHAQLFSSQSVPQQSVAPASTFVAQQPTPAFQFQQRTQAQQQPLQPAFATPTFQQPQAAPAQQTFRQPVQANTLNDFQGQLSLNRFDTGFNFDFS